MMQVNTAGSLKLKLSLTNVVKTAKERWLNHEKVRDIYTLLCY